MTRTLCYALFALLLAAPFAEAKYAIPSIPQTFIGSDVIVVGKVLQVEEGRYRVEILQQIVGPKKALKGEITIQRRPPTRRCKPQDPAGVEAGTKWVWVLDRSKAQRFQYRSKIGTPIRVDAKGHVVYGRLSLAGKQPPLKLKAFVALLRGYRGCVKLVRNEPKRVSEAKVKAFVDSSPYAAALISRTGFR